ncbi:Uncharacterised protein [Mycobacteroides abscessus subsp. massiliense]|nr:Uncharacterised protein [Mycobacteroides abscessus subsp. massiliense]
MTDPNTFGPKWLRTSSATWSASLVLPSYMVSRIVDTCSAGFKWAWTSSMLRSS